MGGQWDDFISNFEGDQLIQYYMLEKIAQLRGEQRLWSVDWHPSGKLLATVGQAKVIKFWSVNHEHKWSLIETLQTSHTKSLRCVKFSHNGQSLAVTSFDSHISIFIKAEQGFEELQVLEGPENEVKSVDWSPDGKHMATCSRDKIVWVWSFNSGNYEYQCDFALEGHLEDIKAVIWLSESTLASCSYDNTIRIWERNDDDFQQEQVLEGHDSIVWSIAFDPKQKALYSVGEDKRMVRWDRNQKNGKFQKIFTIGEIHAFSIYTCSLLTPHILVTGSGDNSLALVKTDKNAEEYLLDRKYHEGDVNCVKCWSGEGNFVASVGDDEKLMIWRVNI